MQKSLTVVSALFLLSSAIGKADEYILPPTDIDLVGDMQYTTALYEDTLLDIARRFDVGQNEIVQANPNVDRWLPGENTKVYLPKRYILPDAPRRGLVLNIGELRMFYYPKTRRGEIRRVTTYPISIGRMDWRTPLGTTKIIAKTKDPAWRPPKSIKAEHAAEGDPLPDVVPAGPDNPLGQYAMRLGLPGYLIHGTNKPLGVGMRVSHGCVRMLPEDIEKLFPSVKVGLPVYIINQPVKFGWLADTFFVEAHPQLEEEHLSEEDSMQLALYQIEKNHPQALLNLDSYALRIAIRQRTGIPIAISRKKYPGDDRYLPPTPELDVF